MIGTEGERPPLIPLLRRLRDWPQPLVPYAQLIALLALDQSYTGMLRAAHLADVLRRDRRGVATTVKPLIKAGLILSDRTAEDQRARDYTLSPLGRDHVAALFAEPQLALS